MWRGEQVEPLFEGVAGQEPNCEHAQFRTSEEHDLGSPLAEPLRAFSAVGEEIEQLVSGQVTGERGEPDLQAGGGGVYGGDLKSAHIAAGDARCVAMQVVADDAHLALHNLRVEGFVVAHAGVVDKAGVVGDSFASHNLYLM